MATEERKPNATLSEQLAAEAKRFEFVRAVQLLQRLYPGTTPIGELGPPDTEAIRFRHDPSFIFHSSDVTSIEPRVAKPGHIFGRITTTFLGLVGAASPLAPHLTEDVFEAEQNEDHSLRDFYDIFHHRLISLLFRAWKKYRFASGFRTDAADAFTKRAFAFVGVDAGGALPQHGLPPGDLLGLASLVSQHTRPPRMLRLILERLLPGVGVDIECFVARRMTIEEPQRVRLGVANTVLGEDMTIGRSVLDRSGAFRVIVGPVPYELYEAFMPGGRHHDRLKRIVDQFSGGVLEPELELKLEQADAPRFRIGHARGAVLGKNTQLATEQRGATRVRIVLGDDPNKSKPRVVSDDEPEVS